MIFERLKVGMLQTNCYLLGDEESGRAAVIDPGAEGERICDRIEELGLSVAAILPTHAHIDHIMAAWTVKSRLGGQIYLHPGDRDVLLTVIFGMAPRFDGEVRPVSPAEIDCPLARGDELLIGKIRISVLETPGHTPGHVSFYLEDSDMIFSGDTIFWGGAGRTDYPGGSHEQLVHSVRSTIFTLPDKTSIYPGHGFRTSVGNEKRRNPFFLRKG